MRILGIDPGLANMGWCIASYTQEAGLSVQLMGCIETKKDQRKVLTSVDNTKRTQSVFEQLLGLMWAEEEGQPVLLVDAIAAEEVSYPRNSSSAAKMSLSWAAAACAASLGHLPIVHASPKDIKEAVTGSRKASKGQVQSILVSMYPETVEALSGVPEGRREHPYDALGAIVASLGSEVVKMGAK